MAFFRRKVLRLRWSPATYARTLVLLKLGLNSEHPTPFIIFNLVLKPVPSFRANPSYHQASTLPGLSPTTDRIIHTRNNINATIALGHRPHPSPSLDFNLYGVNNRGRSRPFDVHSFFESQLSSIKMAVEGEKERLSGEIPRESAVSPILPTINPAVEKAETPQAAFHPSVYVM